MSNKVLAITVVAILVVAAVCGFVAINKSHDDDGDNYSFDGEWVVTYYEIASLVDDDHVPIMDANDVPIEAHIMDPNRKEMCLTLEMKGKNFFVGEMEGVHIAGTVNTPLHGSNSFKFAFTDVYEKGSTHRYSATGVYKGDHISLAVMQHFLGAPQICCMVYAICIPVDGKQVAPTTDLVNYNLPSEHVSTTVHRTSDFTTYEGNPMGTKVDATLDFVKAYSLISIYESNSPRGVGVMALVSLGANSHGRAYASVCGNLLNNDGTAHIMSGNSLMMQGKLRITHSMPDDSTSYVDYVYNVPYYKGTLLPTKFLDNTYVGKVIVGGGGEPTKEYELQKYFQMKNNIIYGHDIGDDTEYDWLGEINGPNIIFRVGSTNVQGYIEGTLMSNGDLVLSGILYKSDGTCKGYHYILSPVD